MNSMLPYILVLLQEYGYPILWLIIFVSAAGIPLPTSLMLLAAGAFAALGDFNLLILIPVAISAFIAGDNTGYLLGWIWGSKLLDWLEASGKFRFIKPHSIARSRTYFNRLGGWAIFFSRFLVSALGGAINILAGAERYPYRRFVVYDAGGETLGASLPLLLGYVFGASWFAIGDILGSLSLFILATLAVLVLGRQAFRTFKRLRKLEKGTAETPNETVADLPAASALTTRPDATGSSAGRLPL